MKRALVLVGTLIAVACRKDGPPPPEQEHDDETVMRTITLELGEGANRDVEITLWPVDDGWPVKPRSGTRIERLQEGPKHTRPKRAPKCQVTSDCLFRVRVLDGEYMGEIGYVRSFQVQAAR